MGLKTAFAAGAFAGASTLFVVGAAAAVAPTPDAPSRVAPPAHRVAPPLSAVPATVTVHEPGKPFMPGSCKDYLARVDETIQAVYDYESNIAPAGQALSDGLKAIVDQDASALNDVRDRINHVQGTTTGPLQIIVQSHAGLVTARAACQKALGG